MKSIKYYMDMIYYQVCKNKNNFEDVNSLPFLIAALPLPVFAFLAIILGFVPILFLFVVVCPIIGFKAYNYYKSHHYEIVSNYNYRNSKTSNRITILFTIFFIIWMSIGIIMVKMLLHDTFY